MYKDFRPKKQTLIYIQVAEVVQVCGGCPTIYDFKDTDGTNYHFRLRHGHARIVCEDTDETLLSESMSGFDGICNFHDAEVWAKSHGVKLDC